MIEVKNFSYQYQGSSRSVLQDISLQIEAGEFLLLTGPSGCGKSTLALALAGFLFTQFEGEYQGGVKVAELDAAREPIFRIADRVGLVQQNPENQFCTLTVEDEIAFGLENRKISREEIEQQLSWALGAAGASNLRKRTLSSLSGGEKQKIALAAILAARPQVIIFDEPTSNLDPRATREIFKVIRDLQEQTRLTVLVIEHKLDFLAEANPRHLWMSQGQLQEGPAPSGTLKSVSRRVPSPNKSPRDPLLRIKNLSVNYPDRKVLSDLDLEVYPGDLISLLGDNGSGKSTLLYSLLKFLPHQEGQITFLNRNLDEYDTRSLGRQIGLVFQNPDHQIFASTVWEEAVLGAENYQLDPSLYQDRTRYLLDRSGLGDRLLDHPYRLSYGEKRRLNLISILSYQPRLLLLDEIFIGQDPANARFLLQLLVDYVEDDNSVLMVNHNPAYYPLVSSRLLFLQEGKLVIDSPIQEGMQRLQELEQQVYLPGGGW